MKVKILYNFDTKLTEVIDADGFLFIDSILLGNSCDIKVGSYLIGSFLKYEPEIMDRVKDILSISDTRISFISGKKRKFEILIDES